MRPFSHLRNYRDQIKESLPPPGAGSPQLPQPDGGIRLSPQNAVQHSPPFVETHSQPPEDSDPRPSATVEHDLELHPEQYNYRAVPEETGYSMTSATLDVPIIGTQSLVPNPYPYHGMPWKQDQPPHIHVPPGQPPITHLPASHTRFGTPAPQYHTVSSDYHTSLHQRQSYSDVRGVFDRPAVSTERLSHPREGGGTPTIYWMPCDPSDSTYIPILPQLKREHSGPQLTQNYVSSATSRHPYQQLQYPSTSITPIASSLHSSRSQDHFHFHQAPQQEGWIPHEANSHRYGSSD